MADRTQIHRIELVVKLDNTDVVNWIDGIYEHFNRLPSEPVVLASDTTPLDIEQIENQWIKNILNESVSYTHLTLPTTPYV